MPPPRPARSARTLDLNADLGECDGDLELIGLVTSANVACGGHAGDEATMAEALRRARAHGTVVGAHAGYADREGFGRIELGLPVEAVTAQVAEQLGRLAAVSQATGVPVRYLKAHGALYHRSAEDAECAEELARLAGRARLGLLCQEGALLAAARRLGLPTAVEAFADRAYGADGRLVPRGQPGAVLEGEEAIAQAVHIATRGTVKGADGSDIPLAADSLCLHGDTAGSAASAARIRTALIEAGVELASPFR